GPKPTAKKKTTKTKRKTGIGIRALQSDDNFPPESRVCPISDAVLASAGGSEIRPYHRAALPSLAMHPFPGRSAVLRDFDHSQGPGCLWRSPLLPQGFLLG